MSSFQSSDDGITTATRFAPTEETELYCPACDQSFREDEIHCPRDGTRLVRLSDVRDPLLGRNLEGRFLIKERLGTGGMGAVYRAWQGSVGREVAVKVIESRLKGGRLAAKRFLREAKLASRLSHANTVSVIDFGQTDDGLLYLVMELVKGRTMNEVLLEEGPFRIDRMIRIGLQLCDALEAAHKLSIIHRDLKPSNIIVLDDPPGRDHVKVLDFGLAKSLIDEGQTTVTQSDAIMGTPSYIPPEAVTRMHFDERSDLYSLGVILYEIVAGRLPFEATTVQAMLRQHAYDHPRPLPEQVPAPVTDLLFRLLEKEPDRRPQSAVETRDILLTLTSMPERMTPLPVSRSVITSPGATFPSPSTPVPVGFDRTMTLRRRSRRWGLLAVMGVALSASAVLIASGVFEPVDEPSPAATTPVEPEPIAAAPLPAATPEPARWILLDLDTDPDGAEVVIDGAVLPLRTPFQHEVPRGSETIVVEFRRAGFEAEEKSIVPDRPQRVFASLGPTERKPAPPAKKSPAKTVKTVKSGTRGGGKPAATPEKQPTKPPVKFLP